MVVEVEEVLSLLLNLPLVGMVSGVVVEVVVALER
jgi:hypothetical protein